METRQARGKRLKRKDVQLVVLSSSDEDSNQGNVEHIDILPLDRSNSGSNGSDKAITGSGAVENVEVILTPGVSGTLNSEQPMLVNNDLIKTLEKSQCSFCYVNIDVGVGVLLRSCLHNFCMECIQALIQQSESLQIICPGDGEKKCGGVLHDLEVKALVSQEAYQNYLNRSLRTAQNHLEDLSSCQNPKCSGIFSIPKETERFKCLICEQVTCLKCKSIRDENGCKCLNLKRSSSENSEINAKMTKIDPAVKIDWELNWSQISKSVAKSDTSTSQLSNARGDRSLKDILNKMELDELLRSTQEFNCSICLMDVSPGNGVILKECFHTFCRECLSGTIEHCEETNVKCPFQINDYSCGGFISDREIKAILTPESHEKYLLRSVNQAEFSMGNSFHCKTVNCSAWCEFEDGADIFKCPVCQKKNCLKCQAIHETITCLEYKSKLDYDKMDEKTKKTLTKLIDSGKAMKCPTCKVVIQKSVGCDGMMCSICKTHICWATKGPRWGPKGLGDRSGGCHCREVRGKLCHPKCRGCH